MEMNRRSRMIIFITLVASFTGLMSTTVMAQSSNAWDYVDDYAPIVYYYPTVKYLPAKFPDDPVAAGSLAYVNIKYPDNVENGYRFQYWFYYTKDVRIDEKTDALLRSIIMQYPDVAQAALSFVKKDAKIEEIFHDHDWECVEVFVKKLGKKPENIRYCAHGKISYLNCTAKLPLEQVAAMSSNQCLVKVISDMHGSYPYYSVQQMWTMLFNNEQKAEILIVAGKLLSSYNTVECDKNKMKMIDYAVYWRPFCAEMKKRHGLEGYPDPMPWDKDFNYQRN